MPLILRTSAGQGALTNAELDGNFTYLQSLISSSLSSADATSLATANKIVQRDASKGFSSGSITIENPDSTTLGVLKVGLGATIPSTIAPTSSNFGTGITWNVAPSYNSASGLVAAGIRGKYWLLNLNDSASVRYQKIATLPIPDTTTTGASRFDYLNLRVYCNKGLSASTFGIYNITMSNRGGLGLKYTCNVTGAHNSTPNTVGIVAYTETDTSVTVYARIGASSTEYIYTDVVSSNHCTFYNPPSTPSTTAPTGTKCFDTCTGNSTAGVADSLIAGNTYYVVNNGSATQAQWTAKFSAYASVIPQAGEIITCTTSGAMAYSTAPVLIDYSTIDHQTDSNNTLYVNRINVKHGATNGIFFPDNAFGGSGDKASIYLTKNAALGTASEDQVLTISVANDSTDKVNFDVPTLDSVTVNGNVILHSGNYSSYVTSTNVTNSTNAAQAIKLIENVSSTYKFVHPGGGTYVNTAVTATGPIKIKLPRDKVGGGTLLDNDTMISMTIQIYDYSSSATSLGNSRTLQIGGYNHNDGNWYHYYANQQTTGGGDITVRFGKDSGSTTASNCIWIGDGGSSWGYVKVYVKDVQVGYNGANLGWGTGWSITMPSQTGLTYNSSNPVTTTNWDGTPGQSSVATKSNLPAQSGNAGRYLTTDGTTLSWSSDTTLISVGGNLGIGLANPSYPVHILRAGEAAFVADNTTSSTRAALGADSVGAYVGAMTANHPLVLYAGNGAKVRIDKSGNLLASGATASLLADPGSTPPTANLEAQQFALKNSDAQSYRNAYYAASNNGSNNQWCLVCSLPPSTVSTYDNVLLRAVINNGFGATQSSVYTFQAGNRASDGSNSGFAAFYTVQGPLISTSGIRCYKRTDGTIDIYAYHRRFDQYDWINVDIVQSTQVTIYQAKWTTTTPTGTLVYDTADTANYPPKSRIDKNGNLTVTGNITGTLATAAQPNVTSLGTLTSLNVSGTTTSKFTTVELSSLTDINTRTNAESGFYQCNLGSDSSLTAAKGWPVGSSNWWQLLQSTHTNNVNYYSLQLASSYYSQGLYYRQTNANATTTTQAWSKVPLMYPIKSIKEIEDANYDPARPDFISRGMTQTFMIVINNKLYTAGGYGTYGSYTTGRISTGGTDVQPNAGVDQLQEIIFSGESGNIKQIGGPGYGFAFCLFDNGHLYMWGANQFGQLGTGDQTGRYMPIITAYDVDEVYWDSSNTDPWGYNYNRVFIRKLTSQIWSCGYGDLGALGLNTPATKSSFFRQLKASVTGQTADLIEDLALTKSGVRNIWNMGSYIGSTFVEFSNGEIWVCGHNNHGQNGTASTTQTNTFTNVTTAWGAGGTKRIKRLIGGFSRSSTIGYSWAAILYDDGSIYTSGTNVYGTLGRGTLGTSAVSTPGQVTISGQNGKIIDLQSLGSGQGTIYALSDTGYLYAWGNNDYGAVSNGNTTHTVTPNLVSLNVTKLWASGINGNPNFQGQGCCFFKINTGALYVVGGNYGYRGGTGYRYDEANYFTSNYLVKLPKDFRCAQMGSMSTADNGSVIVAIGEDNSMYAWGWNEQHGVTFSSGATGLAYPIRITPPQFG